ncbi:MAG: LEA type 2 family protein [Gemmatimonadota bacterium]|jgi:LEA14-like dessication related protein|nr:LEA type 2 family protein [Gemmatimonadota bacterium]
MSRTLSCAVLLLGLAGCGSSLFQQPEVSLQGVQIGGLGLRGGTLLVNVQVVNPNRFSLSASGLRYDLAVGDSRERGDTAWLDFASGTYDRAFSVEGRDTATVQIPVEFTYGGLGGATSSILRSGTFNYRARGEVDVSTPLGRRGVPFNKKGTVTLMGTR